MITNLLEGTQYYYKAFIKIGDFFLCGKEGSFKTLFTLAPIDLGLSVRWANANIESDKPEDYGNSYAWGETHIKHSSNGYKWWTQYNGFRKYNTRPDFGHVVDYLKRLDPVDDIAHVILGEKWRMPTENEWRELVDKCSWSWISRNGVNGCKVVGTNGNSIFLPAAGDLNRTGRYCAGEYGRYWSASLWANEPTQAWGVYFNSFTRSVYTYDRSSGLSIRPVMD